MATITVAQRRILSDFDDLSDGGVLAFAIGRMDILIGRGLAFCLHPQAAWRVLPRGGRVMVIAAYAVAGFVATYATLMLL
jgi:hypothetical protein